MLFPVNDVCLDDLTCGLPAAFVRVTRPGEDLVAAGLDDTALAEIGAAENGIAPLDPHLVCRVRTSEWVPTGLEMAGHPGLVDLLARIADYPSFTLVHPIPAPVPIGADALGAFGALLQSASREIHDRRAAVREALAPIQARFKNERPAPWHITGFDPLAQTVSLGMRPFKVSDASPRGELSDLHTLFLRPFLSPAPRRHVRITVLSADCGTCRLYVRIGRRREQDVIDLDKMPLAAEAEAARRFGAGARLPG